MDSAAALEIGAIIFPGIDQMDFTGPFEVFSRLPNARMRALWKEKRPVRDVGGLILTPHMDFSEAPPLDVLVVPGGYGQEALMDDEIALDFIRDRAARAKYLMTVCTGALICGAAGLLRGRRATTHWSAIHLLKYFGVIAVRERVVLDGAIMSTAGVSAGIDGALSMAALLRGGDVAQRIQLQLQYAPEPPFHTGDPVSAPAELMAWVRESGRGIADARLTTARRIAKRLGVGGV